MSKPFPALCKDCKYSHIDADGRWHVRCLNPIVNSKDKYALSGGSIDGSSCPDERAKMWPAKCGTRGALWEAK